ncbi:MAG: S41 family peptidase [Bacteroidales bacterium]|nr:S41 family peptidase [Bacteroidales bacterium]
MDKFGVLKKVLWGIILIMIGSVITKWVDYGKYSSNKVTSHNWDKISLVLQQIEKNYVDSIDYDAISEKIIPEILKELDPHSVYLPPEELKEADEGLQGNFDGIGITFNVPSDTLVVISVLAGGPSEKVGLVAGDRIVEIDGRNVAGVKFPQDSMMKMLRGTSGTKVNIKVRRDGELVDFQIVRGKIPIKSVDVAYMLNDTTGYIKLSKFSKSSYLEFLQSTVKLRAAGMKKLVFDLRDNPGGYLDQALYLSNEFLKKDQIIVYMQGLHRERQDFKASGNGLCQDLELVVLINENSASSSEIFAGAIQDNNRGLIVGRRSYGKGLVQEPIYFSDNSGIRLTVAKYYTPTGRYIQKPYEKGDDTSYNEDIVERYIHGEMMEKDSIPSSGGGIIPDVFVPVDTVGVTDLLVKINRQSAQMKFSIRMADRYRKELQAIENLEELNILMDSMNLEREFKNYLRDNSIRVVESQWKISEDIIMTQIRAMIGRYSKLEDEAFYPIFAEIDNVIQLVK